MDMRILFEVYEESFRRSSTSGTTSFLDDITAGLIQNFS